MFKSICDKQSHFLLPVTYFITILFGSSGNIHYICNTKVIIFSETYFVAVVSSNNKDIRAFIIEIDRYFIISLMIALIFFDIC